MENKKLNAFLLIIILFVSNTKFNAQGLFFARNEENKITYTGVVEVNDKNQQKLYADAKEYILNNYTAKEFPTILDEENERIYVKGSFKVSLRIYVFPIFQHSKKFDLIYTYKLFFQDSKYKYEITDIYLVRKTNAKGYYWGGAWSTMSIKDGEVIKKDIEDMYEIKRYRKKYNRIFYTIDDEIKKEIFHLNSYMQKENNTKKW